jgi:hypothetical protein
MHLRHKVGESGMKLAGTFRAASVAKSTGTVSLPKQAM